MDTLWYYYPLRQMLTRKDTIVVTQSEIARIREQIELEYQSAQLALTGFSEVAKHEFITTRQENIAGYFEELQQHISPEEAILLVKTCGEVQ